MKFARLVPACICLAAVAAAAAPAQGTPRCQARSLVVWLDTRADGAAGSSYYALEFTNLSTRICTLRGYPRVAAVNVANAQLGDAADRVAPARASVRLAAGKTATAVLQIANAANYPPRLCGPVTAAGLRVYPPGLRDAKLVPFPFAACGSSGAPVLHVRALQPGAGLLART